METSRFFVANLLPSTKEKDLSRLFQDYGEVQRVELKTKENLVDPENLRIIAFVTLKISADDAQYCLNELNWQKVNGAQIKVSLAKESFLDRLKREREEAQQASGETATRAITEEQSSELLTRNSENTRKKFAEDEEFNDDDIAPDLLITKKRAANSLFNGKIVIQSYDTTPIHVIETKKQAKQLDAKSTNADQKRKESLKKMKNDYQQKKTAIQQALAGLDTSISKKIKFSDAEDDEVADQKSAIKMKSKTNIFGSDDEAGEDTPELNLKPEYFGKKGEKLVQLQSKQSLDPRFRIDAKFVDDDEDEEEESTNQQMSGAKQLVESNPAEENERSWQMGILEQVVGSKIDTGNAAHMAAKNKKMLRFDPAKDEHQKFLRTRLDRNDNEPKAKKKKMKASGMETEEEQKSEQEPPPEVSKDIFYVVTDTLAQSLKTRGDGFSLLNMFGKQNELEERDRQLKKVSNEKILVNKTDKNALNPFTYDSSTDEEEVERNEEQGSGNKTQKLEEGAHHKNSKQNKTVKIVMETFFIPKNDARLKEGAKFFKFDKKDGPEEDYEQVRNRLKLLIKTKISKTKKNLNSFKGKK